MKKIFLILIPLLLLAIIWVAFFWEPVERVAKQPSGGEFTLQSSQGEVSLKQFRDKIVLVYFGYTWCPDICPTNLAMMSSALEQLTVEEKKQVQGIFISVDPERDNVERLAEYTQFFHANIMGMTGTKEQIEELAIRYGVAYRLVKQDSATDYVVDHSSETYVIGKQGKLVDILAHATPPKGIMASIRKHLK